MKRIIIGILFIALTLTSSCYKQVDNDSEKVITVGVTILPQKAFVKAVCKDLAEVVELVPPGFSPENYDPDPILMSKLSKAKVFFTLDLPAEEKIDKSLFKDTLFVDLADDVSNIYPDRFFEEYSLEETDHDGHEHTGKDPHIWLSPKRVIVMIQSIADSMSSIDPDNAKTYKANASSFIKELEALDSYITDSINKMNNKKIIVFHPSFGYFADDYGLLMYALEENGKESTASHLIKMIDMAKAEGIKTIYTQSENAGVQAKTFADEIGGEVVKLNPLSEDYIENMKSIARNFAGELDG